MIALASGCFRLWRESGGCFGGASERSTSCGLLDPATSSAFRQLSTAERKGFFCKAAGLMFWKKTYTLLGAATKVTGEMRVALPAVADNERVKRAVHRRVLEQVIGSIHKPQNTGGACVPSNIERRIATAVKKSSAHVSGGEPKHFLNSNG